MQLIYRGEVFNCPERAVPAYRQPRALNWRYRTSNDVYDVTLAPARICKTPRAINWRWQMAAAQ